VPCPAKAKTWYFGATCYAGKTRPVFLHRSRTSNIEPGAEIYLYTADGDEFRYAVTETVQVTPDQVEYVLPQGKEKVTLVSCIGDNVIVDGLITKQYRLITIAEPVR
jgi:LPXTG-site transpeptidase (sortase) family protein